MGRWAHGGSIKQRARDACQWEPKMNASFTRKIRQGRFGVGVRCFLSALSTSQSFAFSSKEQQMCTADAFRSAAPRSRTFRDHRLP